MAADPGYSEAVVDTTMPFPLRRAQRKNYDPPLLDAIYVPTQSHRPATATEISSLLRHSKRVVLQYSNGQAPGRAPEGVEIWDGIEPGFAARYQTLAPNLNPSAALAPGYDIPLKRSAALDDAERRGLGAIGLLDDDISLTERDLLDLRRLLDDGADMVSFHILDFPDVSTVEHVERVVFRRPSEISIGGNCLFVQPASVRTFFPHLYNDDWFFLFAHVGAADIVSAGSARQRPYVPWEQIGRARFEQFGDIVIEGMRTHLSEGRDAFAGEEDFWRRHLRDFRERLGGLHAAAPAGRLQDSVREAMEEAKRISVEDILQFQEGFRTALKEVTNT